MILVIGGTSDARALAAALRDAGYETLLSAVTEYGARLAEGDASDVRSGALDEAELERLLGEADVVVDATHPFAAQITALAVAACARTGRPYLRFERPGSDLPSAVLSASNAAEAAQLAVRRAEAGAILLTVGAKTVATYAEAARQAGVRLVARVLPVPESLAACAAAGLEPRDIVAMQGPTSAGLDAALLRHLGATVLVTKDSGAAGGLGEKLRAAEMAGATAVVVRRPGAPAGDTLIADAPAASTVAEVLTWLAEQPGVAPRAPSRRLARGLLQVYTGDGKGKTTAAAGLALRACGAGLRVTFVQFVKGGRESAELAPLRAAGVLVVRPAVASSGLLRGAPTEADRSAAAAAWSAARAALAAPDGDVVVLDELHAALRHELVSLADVLAAIAARPAHLEVVTTGRGAPQEMLAAADLVTEMTAVRHPYPGVRARRGIEL